MANNHPRQTTQDIHQHLDDWRRLQSLDMRRQRRTQQLFSIDSEAAFLSQRRHFRDVSGHPLFELAMKKSRRDVACPFTGARSTTEPIARIAPRWYIFKYKIDVYVRNAVADGDEVKLEVRGQDLSKSKVQVYFNEASVMSITRKNTALLYDEYEWIAEVSTGLDLSLVGSSKSYLLIATELTLSLC